MVSPGSASRCECGLELESGVRPRALVERDRVRNWERIWLAVFASSASLGTAGLMFLHGEFISARLALLACAIGGAGFAAWTWRGLPTEQRRVSKRGATITVSVTAVVLAFIAYGMHDYLSTTYADGHTCTEHKQCRSTRCYRPTTRAPGVCTSFCETDGDCPDSMRCADGRSLRPGEQFAGSRGDPVRFCVRRDDAPMP